MRKEKVRREKEKNITKLYMIKKSKIEWKITMKWNKKKIATEKNKNENENIQIKR